MKNKIILIVLILLTVLLSTGVLLYQMFGFWLIDASTPIEKGFTTELVDYLKDDYGITIPENAKFLSGENNMKNPQENFIEVFFECPLELDEYTDTQLRDYVFETLKLSSKDFGGLNSSSSSIEDLGFEKGFSHQKHSFTSIYYRVVGDKIEFAFVGYRPSETFK